MRPTVLIAAACCLVLGWNSVELPARCSGTAAAPDVYRERVRKAAAYLWRQQGEDGGWHSRTYGLLRSGQSLTPFVLSTLLSVPGDVFPLPRPDANRALEFIQRNIGSDGGLGHSDPLLQDYPNFATSLAVRCFVQANARGWSLKTESLVACLLKQQFSEARGWPRNHPVYGAWGMGGRMTAPPETGHVDLSMTRHVLQALRDAGDSVGADAACFKNARVYLERCQNFETDGGFYFSTVILEANKAGPDFAGTRYRSYGTASADGALSLLACGVPAGDPRLKPCAAWLRENFRADGVPGFGAHDKKNWTQAMYYYWIAAASAALAALEPGEAAHVSDWRAAVRTELFRRQRADGSWINQEFLMKEDDPLIASTFALAALLHSR